MINYINRSVVIAKISVSIAAISFFFGLPQAITAFTPMTGAGNKITSNLVLNSKLRMNAPSSTTQTDFPKSKIKSSTEAEGVLFDIDGTLADSWKLGFDATQVVLTNNDVAPITEEEYHDHTRYCTPDRLARHAGYLPDTHPKEFVEEGERLGREFDDLYVDLVSLETARFYDGIADLLYSLPIQSSNGVKIGALTNACAAYGHAVLKTNCPVVRSSSDDDGSVDAIYQRFTSIHGADTVPEPKPSPKGLLKCCEEMGVDPQKCVYIGDSPSDGLAAKNAGMIAIGVMWGSHPEESLRNAPFDHLCRTVDELRELLPKEC